MTLNQFLTKRIHKLILPFQNPSLKKAGFLSRKSSFFD